MQGKILNTILILSLAIFANIEVAQAGSSPHDVCEIYVDTFSIIYNQSVTSLAQSFQDANHSMHLVNVYLPREDYLDQLKAILFSWYDENSPTIQAAFESAASLTGSTNEYLQSLVISSVINPPSPVSCIYDMIIELYTTLSSLYGSLENIVQLLSDSQLVVGDHRPSLESSTSS
ncbi:hypothetical protein ACKWTF_013952 [Chironomus riparius]